MKKALSMCCAYVVKSGWMLFNVFDLYVYSILIWEGGTEAAERRPQTSVLRVPAV